MLLVIHVVTLHSILTKQSMDRLCQVGFFNVLVVTLLSRLRDKFCDGR